MSLEIGSNGRKTEKYPFPERVPPVIEQWEKSAHEFAVEYPETAMRLHDRLSSIKLKGLQSAFKNVIESVHGSFDAERVVAPEQTYITKGEGDILGEHFPGVGLTNINGMSFVEMSLPLQWQVAKLLHTVCHENTHAVGRISFHVTSNDMQREVGYWTTIKSGATYAEAGVLFNEGMTEKISKRVAREYLIGYPMALEDGSFLDINAYDYFLSSPELSVASQNYVAAEHFVDSLSVHVANALKTTPKLVEDAFVAGYFRGTGDFFNNPDFLDSVLGPGFSEQVRTAQNADDLKKIISEYQMPPIPSMVQEMIEKELQQLPGEQS